MRTLPFAGFKIKVLTHPLIPKNRIYAFSSPRHAREFVEILTTFDRLIKSGKFAVVVKRPKKRIVRPS